MPSIVLQNNTSNTSNNSNSYNTNNNQTPVQTFRNAGNTGYDKYDKNNINNINQAKNIEQNEFDEFTMFGEDYNNNINNTNNIDNTNSNNINNIHNNIHFATPQNNVPGFNVNNNQTDFREIKNTIVEKEIVKYISEHSAFDQDEFFLLLKKSSNNAGVKIDEDSALWTIANMIKKDRISPKIFFLLDKKNILDMYLKSILNRHWTGPDTKLSNILKMLQERDETKEITIVDLVTWLKHNKYFEK